MGLLSPRTFFNGKSASALLLALTALLGSSEASAQLCFINLCDGHDALEQAVRLGGRWTCAKNAQVPAMRFRGQRSCGIEVAVPGWRPKTVLDGENGLYLASLTRVCAGQNEVLDVGFRFAGHAGRSWIEVESWYHSSALRAIRGTPQRVTETLFHQAI